MCTTPVPESRWRDSTRWFYARKKHKFQVTTHFSANLHKVEVAEGLCGWIEDMQWMAVLGVLLADGVGELFVGESLELLAYRVTTQVINAGNG